MDPGQENRDEEGYRTSGVTPQSMLGDVVTVYQAMVSDLEPAFTPQHKLTSVALGLSVIGETPITPQDVMEICEYSIDTLLGLMDKDPSTRKGVETAMRQINNIYSLAEHYDAFQSKVSPKGIIRMTQEERTRYE
ncbi:MAG: hypothetical protein R6U32_00795 [Candidatus Woesearchaeota archaeon]